MDGELRAVTDERKVIFELFERVFLLVPDNTLALLWVKNLESRGLESGQSQKSRKLNGCRYGPKILVPGVLLIITFELKF